MTTWQVEFSVPVVAEVEVDDTGEMVMGRVHISDEEIALIEPLHVCRWDGSTMVAASEAEAKRLADFANGDEADWPAWEFGW